MPLSRRPAPRHIEKIAYGDPEPFTPRPETPLGGVRALGFSHVIAGPGMGRGLAYHGADVLNLWTPDDFEMDFNYYSANVGTRSAIMDFRRSDEMARFRQLVAGADIFFANRRPGLLEKLGITSSELARLRPGIVQVDFSISRMRKMPAHTRTLRSPRSPRASRSGAGRHRRWWARMAV